MLFSPCPSLSIALCFNDDLEFQSLCCLPGKDSSEQVIMIFFFNYCTLSYFFLVFPSNPLVYGDWVANRAQ